MSGFDPKQVSLRAMAKLADPKVQDNIFRSDARCADITPLTLEDINRALESLGIYRTQPSDDE